MNGLRVVVVEDDVWLGQHFERTLISEGYDVKVVSHALDAIEVIDTKIPDVIVLDVLLTATTGFALLHELQSYDDTARIPVVLCTNLADSFRLEDVAPYGVRRILDKTTMLPEDLVAAIRSIVL